MKTAGMIFLTLIAFGSLMQACEGAESTDGYPACSEIAQYPGTWSEAKCAEGDRVKEVEDTDEWDTYHPYD